MSYQGYKNYETWAVCLWFDNDQGMQGIAYMLAAQDVHGQAFKEWVEDDMPDGDSVSVLTGLYQDLLTGTMQNVDWKEVRDHFVDDTEEDSG